MKIIKLILLLVTISTAFNLSAQSQFNLTSCFKIMYKESTDTFIKKPTCVQIEYPHLYIVDFEFKEEMGEKAVFKITGFYESKPYEKDKYLSFEALDNNDKTIYVHLITEPYRMILETETKSFFFFEVQDFQLNHKN